MSFPVTFISTAQWLPDGTKTLFLYLTTFHKQPKPQSVFAVPQGSTSAWGSSEQYWGTHFPADSQAYVCPYPNTSFSGMSISKFTSSEGLE